MEKLWYIKAASIWEEALPVGNGRLGGMVYGGVYEEVIQLNEDTLWSGSPYDPCNYDSINYLDEARKLIFEGKYLDAQKVIEDKMCGHNTALYQPLGYLKINFNFNGDAVDYYRELDLKNAIVKTKFKVNEVTYTREVFCSNPDQVLIVKLTTDNENSLNLNVGLDSLLHYAHYQINHNTIGIEGKTPYNPWGHKSSEAFNSIDDISGNMKFDVQIKVLNEGGELINSTREIKIVNANEVIVILSAATSFNGFAKNPTTEGKNSKKICSQYLDLCSQYSFKSFLERHLNDYQELYNRVEINLGANDDVNLPTDVRIEKVKKGNIDKQLAALYFQYGRYLLISCSRQGTQPANLQGIWNYHVTPPWSCNYTTNINLEMNYWPTEVTNLSECHEPLFKMLGELSVTGHHTAKVQYNCNGWTLNHNTDIWRHTIPVSGKAMWAYWPLGGAWLCSHLWEHYLYTKDRQFLIDTAYPIMKGAALFILDWLVEDKNGYLVTIPSTSPENNFKFNEESCSVSLASTMDMALIWDLFNNCMKASEVINNDLDFRNILKKSIKKLYPYKIGKYGQLNEWFEDFDEFEPGHRHVSHLFGLYPGKQITSGELLEACRNSLHRRLSHGGGHTGWSCAWIINLFARLKDNDNTLKYLYTLLGRSSYPNLFDAHPPFQIDGNFGGTAGIAEMLIQSHTEIIELLPCLPNCFDKGYVKGLKARGNYEVDLQWENNLLVYAKIKANFNGVCKVKTNNNVDIFKDNQKIEITRLDEYTIQFDVIIGEYDLKAI